MSDYLPDSPGLGLSKTADVSATPTLGIAQSQQPNPFGPDPLSDFSRSRRIWTGLADWAATTRGEPTASERIIAVRQQQALAVRKAEMEAAGALQTDMDKKLNLVQELPEDQRDPFIAKFAQTYEAAEPGAGALFEGIAKHRQANAVSLDEAIRLDPEVSAAYGTGGAPEALKVLGKEQTLKRLAWWGNEKLIGPTIRKGIDGIKWLRENEPEALQQALASDQEMTFAEFEQLNALLPKQMQLDGRELAVASSEPRFYEAFSLPPPGHVTDRRQKLDDAMIAAQVNDQFGVGGVITMENIETGKPRAFTRRQAAEAVTREPGKWAEVQTQRVGEANKLPATKRSDLMGELAKIDETESSMNDLEKIVSGDEATVGITGTVAEVAQNTGASARAMTDWIKRMQAGIAANPVMDDKGQPSQEHDFSYYFDKNIPVAKSLGRLLPYQLASAFAAQSGRGLSDRDVKQFEGLLGTDQMLANPQSVLTNLKYFKERLPEIRAGLSKRLGADATADLDDMEFQGLVERATKYKSDRPRVLRVLKKKFPGEYEKWKKERQQRR